ncbi:MAG: exo-alpha-sialidase, partial [Gemmatimonadetes bacterium]|nr:exo-alpha-sialidase [Gemmatimonadota bacterium]
MNCVLEPLAVSGSANTIHVYATVHMGPANPVDYVGGVPCWIPPQVAQATVGESTEAAASGLHAAALGGFVPGQEWDDLPEHLPPFLHVIELGTGDGDAFVPVVRFGLADDRRGLGRSKGEQGWFWNEDDVAGRHKAHVCAWVSDGTIDYFGPFVRPDTPCDFKLHIDLNRGRLTAWVVGRGDQDWFLLAEDVALPEGVTNIDRVRTSVFPDAPAVDGPKVLPEPWPEGETLRPHPQAKADCVVAPAEGLTCRSMRSTWRKPGKHVTVFREQGEHAGFPDVAWDGDRRLVCAWRVGSHTGGGGGLSYACSDDLGKTWSKAARLTELAVNTVRVQQLAAGPLLLSSDCLSEDHDPSTGHYDGILWDSVDGGKTWGNERRRRGGPGAHDNSRILGLSDGSWMTIGSTKSDRPNSGHLQELVLYRSTDKGETWSCFSRLDDYPPRVLCEPTLLEVAPDRLVMYARELRSDGVPGARGFSGDGGMTWCFQDLPIPIVGRTCAGLLKDGRVLL